MSNPLPTVDLSGLSDRHVVIAQGTDDVYQGHPTTVLMPDGKTIICVWSINHGGYCGPMAKSLDGGKTWMRIETPANWSDVKNCPSIYRLPDPQGRHRLFVFAAAGPDGAMHQAVSEDEGLTWSPMSSNGLKCIMPFCTIKAINEGRQLVALTNIRRPNDDDPDPQEVRSNVVAQSVSDDGGFTWSAWEIACDLPGRAPCEPMLLRSPDGKELLCLMRENSREHHALFMTSADEGKTWSEAADSPWGLTGDRHMSVALPDGRLVIAFRDRAPTSETYNHFVAWVGTYDDIRIQREGQYRIKLLHSHARWDCGYPGLELLPDGTIVATTYIKYRPGSEKHSVVSTRFTIDETDAQLKTEMKS